MCSVDYYHRILDGIYTETKSLKKILTENALEYLALWRDFLGIALQARHPNENLENNLKRICVIRVNRVRHFRS